MTTGFTNQDKAVQSGAWPLYRFDPRRIEQGENPLQIDSKAPSIAYQDYISAENRWKMLSKTNPEQAQRLAQLGQQDVNIRWHLLEQQAGMSWTPQEAGE